MLRRCHPVDDRADERYTENPEWKSNGSHEDSLEWNMAVSSNRRAVSSCLVWRTCAWQLVHTAVARSGARARSRDLGTAPLFKRRNIRGGRGADRVTRTERRTAWLPQSWSTPSSSLRPEVA